MPGPHLVSSLLKRWTVGTLHYRVSRQHMPYYLDEFTFRFNRRTSKARGMLFYRLLQQAVDTDPHPLKDLIGVLTSTTALKQICRSLCSTTDRNRDPGIHSGWRNFAASRTWAIAARA